MVPRTFGKQIVYRGVWVVLATALVLLIAKLFSLGLLLNRQTAINKNIVYKATNAALDLAVLDGIVAVEKSDSDEGVGSFSKINLLQPVQGDGLIRAVVVPHHLVASKSIAMGIKALALKSLSKDNLAPVLAKASSSPNLSPKIVVIISPDHFAQCPKMLCTTKGSFESFFGTTLVAEKEVKELEEDGALEDTSGESLVADSELFTKEHGVYTIIPFIKHYIPGAQVVPIVVSQKNRGSEETRAKIIALLKPLLSRKDVALVVSSDFSHYLPLAESNKMDIKTQNSFCSGNSKEILSLQNPNQSDCPLCLWILNQEALDLGFRNPYMLAHTNSAELMHDSSAKETTSHFVFIFSDVSLKDVDKGNLCKLI